MPGRIRPTPQTATVKHPGEQWKLIQTKGPQPQISLHPHDPSCHSTATFQEGLWSTSTWTCQWVTHSKASGRSIGSGLGQACRCHNWPGLSRKPKTNSRSTILSESTATGGSYSGAGILWKLGIAPMELGYLLRQGCLLQDWCADGRRCPRSGHRACSEWRRANGDQCDGRLEKLAV